MRAAAPHVEPGHQARKDRFLFFSDATLERDPGHPDRKLMRDDEDVRFVVHGFENVHDGRPHPHCDSARGFALGSGATVEGSLQVGARFERPRETLAP